MKRNRPIPDSYWIDFSGLGLDQRLTGRLLAGEYPGAKQPEDAQRKLESILEAGATLFVDLTEAGEYGLRPYASAAAVAAGERSMVMGYQRIPIPDMSTPSKSQMVRILDTLDEALAEGKTVYVHCFGGIGRTGTVVGCWLVRHGLTGRQSLAKIGVWRRDTPDGWRTSPETDAQRRMVMEWQPDQ
jgi:hypothetical protein